MIDVARVAGVSGQTVSRVANGSTNVVPETRDRVLQAMRELGYRPNGAARALRSGRFRTIGVVHLTLAEVGHSRMVEAIAIAAADAGYRIALLPLARPTSDEVVAAFDRLSEQAVDGAITVFEANLLDDRAILLPPALPVVMVDSGAHRRYPVVDTDQAAGARQATEHLLDLGHATVRHVSGPVDSRAAQGRLGSWRETLLRRGRPVPEVLVGDWSAETGYRHGLALADDPEVTAVFCANDQTALGVLRALHESGRGVPEDVSVVGFDGLADTASFWPPLTTVSQSFTAVGAALVRTLLAAIENEPHPLEALVPTRLVVRRSTGPPGRPG